MLEISESGVNLFAETLPTTEEIKTLSGYVNCSEYNQEEFECILEEQAESASKLSVGIGQFILGKYSIATETLSAAEDCKEKFVYMAKCLIKIRKFDAALDAVNKAAEKGMDSLIHSLEKASILISKGDYDQARATLDMCVNLTKVSAEYHYQIARLQEKTGEYEESIDNLETAVELDEEHFDAMFFLAYSLDLRGDEESAADYYRQIAMHPPVSLNALMNLAVLYEDMAKFEKASECIEKVLTSHPNNRKALLFYKDINSSKTMLYDEDKEKQLDKQNKVLEIPISDFELSVRSRNCLKKMNINTLGDLLRINESELLSYKNFGETSLTEIRSVLETKSLRLGMALEEKPRQNAKIVVPEGVDDESLNKLIDELELSVRARRAIDRLGIRTLGEICIKTEAELLGCKNFGVTSLTEIKEKLSKFGLSLRRID